MADIPTNCDYLNVYKFNVRVNGNRTHKCTSLNLARNSVKTFKVEITPCSSFSLGGFSFVWWEKVLMDPKCD